MNETTEWVKVVNECGTVAEIPKRDLELWIRDGWKLVEG